MKHIPFIITEIILNAVNCLEDAEYENHAKITLGDKAERTFVLIDRDEFKELVDFLTEYRHWNSFQKDFDKIVKPSSENENKLELF